MSPMHLGTWRLFLSIATLRVWRGAPLYPGAGTNPGRRRRPLSSSLDVRRWISLHPPERPPWCEKGPKWDTLQTGSPSLLDHVLFSYLLAVTSCFLSLFSFRHTRVQLITSPAYKATTVHAVRQVTLVCQPFIGTNVVSCWHKYLGNKCINWFIQCLSHKKKRNL